MARPRKPARIRWRDDVKSFEIVDGKRRIGLATDNELEAYIKLDQYRAGLLNPKAPANKPLVKHLLTAFDGATSKYRKSARTQQQCIEHLKKHLGALEPVHISQETIDNLYVEERRKDVWKHPSWKNCEVSSVSDSTIRRELTVMRQALYWADKNDPEGWFSNKRVPTFEIKLAPEVARQRWLSKEEAKMVMGEVQLPHLRTYIIIALHTGARKSAILQLTWDKVDLEKGYVDFGDDVGNKKRPHQQIAPDLLEFLKIVHEFRTTDYVVEFNGRAPLKDIKRSFNHAMKKLGLEGVTPHTLKHTAISWMVQSGMAYEAIAKAVSTSSKTIEKVYGHHNKDIYDDMHKATKFM